jgi:TRAP-type C4-dicarboxylate transport system substrate-binding protein
MLRQLFFVFVLLLVNTATVQAFTFKIATLSTDGSVWMQKMRAGAKEINKRTDKRVAFKFYPGGVMGGDKNVLRKMRFGQLHGAALPAAGLNEVYPDIQLYNLVLKFQSLDEIDFVRQRMDTKLILGLKNKGFISFGLAEMGLAYLMSTSPIASVAELRQQKTWVPDSNKIAINAFKVASVSPIPLPLRDVLMGLQTGMIDTVAGTPTGALALQWHTKIKYVTELPLAYIFGVFALTEKAFNKISKQDQLIVTEVMTRVASEIDKQSRKDNVDAVAALKSQGIRFVAVEQSAANELKNIMESANQQIIQDSGMSIDLLYQLDTYLLEFSTKTIETKSSE